MKRNRLAKGLMVLIGIMVMSGMVFAAGAPEDEAKSLLISRWAGPHADDLKAVVRDYPNGDITVDDIDYGSLRQKQLTSFQATPGNGNYDAVWVASQWMKEYVEAGYLMPIDDLIAENGFDTGNYAAGMMEGVQFDGNTYGLPTFAQTLILAYDSAAFEEAGVDVPTTSEELIAVARYFKENQGTGIAIPARQGSAAVGFYSQILFSSGGYYFDDAGNLDLTSPESIYAATVYDQLVDNAVEGVLAWHHDEVAEAVRTKNAPIGVIMSGLANQNHDPERSMIVDTVKYQPLAAADGYAAANNNFWVWAIPANVTDEQASFDLVTWLTSPEVEKQMTMKNQQISAITSLSNDSEVLEAAPFLPVVMEALGNGLMDPALANFQTLREAMIVGLSEIASTDADPATVLARVQEELK
ncbi:MAG: extracellular solute-binding protein, partial [Spirochaetaceae bacterium]|nr:extracellular solute-binding protein [Spirochaetaceae bacterium]